MNNDRKVFGLIGLISTLVICFLFWLIYFKNTTSPGENSWYLYLPVLNALLNSVTAALLISGYVFIKKNNIEKHKVAMLLATFTSALFLISYITYHHYHGDTKFMGVGISRTIYFFILITHILLSIVQVPLILVTLYLAFTKQFVKHRKIARVTFPVWLYVSLTGVLIFIFLNWFNLFSDNI